MSHRSTLRRGRTAVVAGLIATAALGLTACNGTGGSDAAPASSVSAADPGSQGGSTGSQGSGGTTGGSGGAATASAHSSGGTGGSGGHGGRKGQSGDRLGHCTTDGLQAGWGSEGGGVPDMKSDQQQTAAVWLKNISGTPCSISGFPGVQIKGTDGTTWDLQRSAKKPESKVLKPNAHTTFTLTLLPSTRADDKKVEPGQVLITPPNEKKHFQLQWPFGGAILDQSGATHPGTFVNPVNVP
ncbi:DUF4232 domain-containing protein [Streptomyces yunnanensis]|uniref:DUF4232 domain-containing protein n=1 Tax=Streptomyces yunnanensis TaxID=156453 RepID=A0ABY8A5B8_9ACTN|nr:DUF4232 domain-containing protein [Streptomyces yunnanensis]WEB40148.1 DUF4232 domain-containing protein [Streptomyces yunnanensis]